MDRFDSLKNTNAIFLAIVLIAGTIAALYPSFMIYPAQAQPYYDDENGYSDYRDDKKKYDDSYGPTDHYYGMDNNRKSYESNSYGPTDYRDNKDRKSYGNDNSYESQYSSYGKDDSRDKSSKDSKVDINKIKCINTNLNINGNNTGDVNVGNKGKVGAGEEGYSGAYSSNGGNGGYGGDGYNKQDKGSDCIINNNNTNIGGNSNQTIPPKEPTATLNITKVIECRETGTSPTPGTLCQELLPLITEDQFLFQVEGNNPNPSSQFPGSESGTIVTLSAGNYVVSETLDEAGITELNNFRTSHPAIDILFVNAAFTGNCIETFGISFPNAEATGTIAAGESQTCNVRNVLEILF